MAFVRTLYAVERDIAAGQFGGAVAADRRVRASPVLDRFAAWSDAEVRATRPRSPLGVESTSARNGWAGLTRPVTDGRPAVGNGPAERAVHALAVGRRNWLFVGGDGGRATAAVMLRVVAPARPHGLNAWSRLRDLFDRRPALPAGADRSDHPPDAWAKSHLGR